MPGIHKYKEHTPITSKKQQGFFGAELARRRAGKRPRAKGLVVSELRSHLKESKGKNLPLKAAIKRRKKKLVR